ncbi:MAG: hypothetical protein ACKPKO_43500, partial [Candidatus Fonsibacter sp.]
MLLPICFLRQTLPYAATKPCTFNIVPQTNLPHSTTELGTFNLFLKHTSPYSTTKPFTFNLLPQTNSTILNH